MKINLLLQHFKMHCSFSEQIKDDRDPQSWEEC